MDTSFRRRSDNPIGEQDRRRFIERYASSDDRPIGTPRDERANGCDHQSTVAMVRGPPPGPGSKTSSDRSRAAAPLPLPAMVTLRDCSTPWPTPMPHHCDSAMSSCTSAPTGHCEPMLTSTEPRSRRRDPIRRASRSRNRCLGEMTIMSTAPINAATVGDHTEGSGSTTSNRSRALRVRPPQRGRCRCRRRTPSTIRPQKDRQRRRERARWHQPRQHRRWSLSATPRREQRGQRIMNRKGLLTGERERRDPIGDQLELSTPRGLVRAVERVDGKVSHVPRCHLASIEHLFASCKRCFATRRRSDALRRSESGDARSCDHS